MASISCVGAAFGGIAAFVVRGPTQDDIGILGGVGTWPTATITERMPTSAQAMDSP